MTVDGLTFARPDGTTKFVALPPWLAQAEYCLDCGLPFDLDPDDPEGIVPHEHG
jgi:hypothetical protein